jgi:hypothetical protein
LRRARFAEEAEHFSVVDRAFNSGRVRVAGKENSYRARGTHLHLGEDLDTGHPRHALIRYDDVHVVLDSDTDCLGTFRAKE